MTDPAKIERLEELKAETTGGHWSAKCNGKFTEIVSDQFKTPIVSWPGFDDSERERAEHEANARLMSAAVNALPSLLAYAKLAAALRAEAEAAFTAVTAADGVDRIIYDRWFGARAARLELEQEHRQVYPQQNLTQPNAD